MPTELGVGVRCSDYKYLEYRQSENDRAGADGSHQPLHSLDAH